VHLQRAARATRKPQPLLDLRSPPAAQPLWDAFTALSGSRAPQLGPITCAEIEAWARLMAVALTPWEVETLQHMDRAARAAYGTPPQIDE